MKKINKKYGTIFLITGLPGVGKTTLARKILKKVKKYCGATLLINGDDIRNIFQFKKYSFEERVKLHEYYTNFIKFIIKQKINLVFTTVSLSTKDLKLRKYSKNIIKIYLKANYKTRYKFKKKIYRLKKMFLEKIFRMTTGKKQIS